ncbi:hypothetical protein GCK32_019252 [Trichostrongylus colubriformis]|uniref:Uncharacterized protein n=1 Tax=Trichostrongylus colubriformis TaxID=6319 RepID=A0AAN8F2G7_TRICO
MLPQKSSERTANQTIAPSPSVQTITHEDKAEVTLSPLPKLVTETDLQRSNLPNQVDESQLIPQSLRIPSAEGTRALPPLPLRETTLQSMNTREESFLRSKRSNELFDRPKMNVLKNVSAISLDEFWSNAKY